MANCIKYKWGVAFLLLSLGTAAKGEMVGNYVQEVRISGSNRISEATIRSHLKTSPGRIVDRKDVNDDIQKLFKLGLFSDIQVDEERGPKGWIYTFFVTEKSVIGKILIEGNKKIRDSGLKEVITISLYHPLSEQKLVESVEAMRELYAKKRYYLVTIDYQLRAAPTGESELVFTIREEAPALVREVLFVGNAVFTDEALRKVIKTKKKGSFGWLTGSGKYSEEQIQQDLLRLTFHYLKNGYLKVKVDSPQVALTKDRRYFFITFRLREGDRYTIGKIDISGDILTTKEELLSDILTKSGEIYNREYIEKDIQSLTKRYADQGYAFVHVLPLTTTEEIEKTADILFEVEKGSRITIENIAIEGNTITRDKVIRRELKIKEGDIYNESKIQESRERVMALGFFKDINFATPRGKRDDTLDLNIEVEERPTGSFSVGAGFSTTENFVFTGSLQKQNFFGRGFSGELSAEISSRRQQFVFSMVDPYFLDTEWILGLSSFRSVFRFEDFDRESYGGSFSIGHRFFDYASVNIGYKAEQVEATDFAEFVPARFRENASGLTSLVSLTLNRDTRDNRLFANKGMFHSAVFEVSGDKLGGDNDFFRVTGRSQFYFPLFKGVIFKNYGRVGYIQSLNNDIIPLFDRFFLGGVNSLRGYFPQSIGPAERVTTASGGQTNFVFGGNKLLVINTELEYPIYDPAGLRFVTFFDAGNAFGEGETLAMGRLRLDWGFGIRWISPMGPLRFEWGFPINRKPDEKKIVFNFTIGSFF